MHAQTRKLVEHILIRVNLDLVVSGHSLLLHQLVHRPARELSPIGSARVV
jgi:hypothetical protein